MQPPLRATCICLGPILEQRPSLDDVVNRLRDVGDVITDALNILGTEQKLGSYGDGVVILHHVGEEFPEQRTVQCIDFLVRTPDLERLRDVAVHITMK